jgi:SAM-dependent methyltransferase
MLVKRMVAREQGSSSSYVEHQYSENYPPGVEHTYWHLARNAIVAENLLALGTKCALDVGCGRGILVEYLNEHGIDCYGVDPGEVPVPRQLAGRLFCGVTAQELDAAVRLKFDTIILGDVIEHIEDPHAFLVELQSCFPRVRGFLIMVPARQELWSNYDDHYGHYRRYDLSDLRQTVEGAGLRVQHVSYFFKLLYPLMWLILKVRGRRSTQLRGPKGGTPLHRFLAALLRADYHWLPRGIFGTSALCRAVVREQSA